MVEKSDKSAEVGKEAEVTEPWLIKNFKRSRVSLLLVLLVVVSAFLLPNTTEITPREALLSLITTKTIGVSMGVLIAHYSRVFRFPYMDLEELINNGHWAGVIFLAVWYGVIIWAFSMGG